MIMSNLARKVFDQTDIPYEIPWAWWVEKKLQHMRINGLVQMIQKSKELDRTYIDGYLPMYKWSFRKDGIDISKFAWLYSIIQIIGEDFNWGLWEQLVKIRPDHIEILMDAIHKSMARGISNLAYILKVYEGVLDELKSLDIMPSQVCIKMKDKNLSATVKKEWSELKDLL